MIKTDISSENDYKTLSVFFNNIDGVTSNFDKLHTELSILKNKFNIITLAETNVDSTHKNLFNLPGYQSVYQSKIPHKHKGSGLGIYVEESFIFDTLDEYSSCSKDIETLFVKITNLPDPIIVGVIYRPPSGDLPNFYTLYDNLLEKLPATNVVISGDFNINLHNSVNSKYEL